MAFAHDSRPLSIHVKIMGSQNYSLSWQEPPSVRVQNSPNIILEPPCQRLNGNSVKKAALYTCPEDPPVKLSISYPLYNPGLSTVIIHTDANGHQDIITLPPDVQNWSPSTAEIRQASGVVFLNYIKMGIVHIFNGLDHLLFLLLLVLMVGSLRPLLWMISGFTLAHTLTLALSIFGFLKVRIDIVEILIALSIVFLAAEILRGNKETLSWRRPVLITSLFGLIHGLGFANVLREIGFSEDQSFLSLAGFNIGVEVGQIVFVTSIWLVLTVSRKAPRNLMVNRFAQTAPLWGIGLLAGFWTIERIHAVMIS